MTGVSTDERVGQLAVKFAAASRVFARHGIDFCCGGGVSLQEACSGLGLDANRIAAEIADSGDPAGHTRWDERPLDEVIDYILDRFHAPLSQELTRLVTMANRVNDVHGHKDPERLSSLLGTLNELVDDLMPHMHKEEEILFPWIRSGQGRTALGPISVMQHEHDEVAVLLATIRRLTDDFQPPADACNTWRALWLGLAELDSEMREHIHLENNVLFPRALGE